jgi:hypothetical protein
MFREQHASPLPRFVTGTVAHDAFTDVAVSRSHMPFEDLPPFADVACCAPAGIVRSVDSWDDTPMDQPQTKLVFRKVKEAQNQAARSASMAVTGMRCGESRETVNSALVDNRTATCHALTEADARDEIATLRSMLPSDTMRDTIARLLVDGPAVPDDLTVTNANGDEVPILSSTWRSRVIEAREAMRKALRSRAAK